MNNKWVMFFVMVFVSAFSVVGYETLVGLNEQTIILDVEFDTVIINHIESFPIVIATYTFPDETHVRMDRTAFNGVQRRQLSRILKGLERQQLNSQANLVFNPSGTLNCRTGSNGRNYTSSLSPTLSPNVANEVWTVNAICNSLSSISLSP